MKYDTAKGWRRRNSIPPERWFETIEMAKEKDVPGVTHEVLHALRTVGKYQRGASEAAEVAA